MKTQTYCKHTCCQQGIDTAIIQGKQIGETEERKRIINKLKELLRFSTPATIGLKNLDYRYIRDLIEQLEVRQ